MKVAIAYKQAKPATDPHSRNPYNAGGLAVNALHTVDVLRRIGVDAVLLQVTDAADLEKQVDGLPGLTHLIVEAVWLSFEQTTYLARKLSHGRAVPVKLVIRAHSKMGFLQVEPEAVTLMRQIIGMGDLLPNLFFASNNAEFASSLSAVYGPTLYLPNLYDLAGAPPRTYPSDRLRIASFGATRLLKLHPVAALAALQIAETTGRQLDFFINVDKTPGGESVRRTIANMFAGLQDARLVEVGWEESETFKRTIASMDLVLQLSATETFCMVAADAVASGVPVVTGPAITWVPAKYQVNIDDTTQAAAVGVQALRNGRAAARELAALDSFIVSATATWLLWLELPRRRWWE